MSPIQRLDRRKIMNYPLISSADNVAGRNPFGPLRQAYERRPVNVPGGSHGRDVLPSKLEIPSSIYDSLNPTWRDPNREPDVPVRKFKGIHDRQKRSQGTTPNEAQAINSLMAQMLEDFSQLSTDKTPDSRNSFRAGFYPHNRIWSAIPPINNSYPPSKVPMRMLERMETEGDFAMLEELDSLKEEMGTCRTDVDLIKWAKKNVFAPISDPNPSPDSGPRYPPVYPRILALLLSYIRRNFSNPHLVLALFHFAQTQSPESYLSGCLAPAYNEVLKTRWESFNDLEGVEAGVKEMEANGVAWDRGTAKTIGKIVDDVGREVFMGTGWQEKYGNDVHMRLAKLEDRLQRDIQDQARAYAYKKKEKVAMRAEAAMRHQYAGNSGDRQDAYF